MGRGRRYEALRESHPTFPSLCDRCGEIRMVGWGQGATWPSFRHVKCGHCGETTLHADVPPAVPGEDVAEAMNDVARAPLHALQVDELLADFAAVGVTVRLRGPDSSRTFAVLRQDLEDGRWILSYRLGAPQKLGAALSELWEALLGCDERQWFVDAATDKHPAYRHLTA